jgi:hypothetical protein
MSSAIGICMAVEATETKKAQVFRILVLSVIFESQIPNPWKLKLQHNDVYIIENPPIV